MELIKELLYDTGKPLSEFYAWMHGYWAVWNMPAAALDIIIMIVVAAVVAVFLALNALFIIYYERKFAALIQIRKGPNRVGPFGIFQTVADALKMLLKEDINPRNIDKGAFWAAPFIIFTASFAVFLVIPFGKGMIAGDLNIGILYILAISGLAVISILAAGWGSNNKYSLIGGLRSAAQIVSYEIPLILTVLAVILLAESMQMSKIVEAQSGMWYIVLQPAAFIIFLIAGNAELNRGPFDLPEAESELVSGFITEYSAMKFAFFFLAEYTNLFLISAIATALFLGGWQGPLLPPFIWFMIKTYFIVTILMWARWTFPRIRIDHLMEFCWKVLLPIALLNLLATAFVIKILQ
ncbi:MAG: NADH-quinone oxidoreductase subunit NuoH [Candidatus Goldiibacteriota bacterium]